MNEAFLQHIWKHRLFTSQDLRTITGEPVLIINPGRHNTDAGPDFFNARLKIGEQEWAGNVEIHVKSSLWNVHKHNVDAAYNNIILHVVYEHDKEIKTPVQGVIPTMELKGLIDTALLDKYQNLEASMQPIACANKLSGIEGITIDLWLERLLVERLEKKSDRIHTFIAGFTNNIEEGFYVQLARNFGFSVNADPFELLAKSLPLVVLAKHKQSLFQIEALLFGQAGMLEDEIQDDYFLKLKSEYNFLKTKYSLKPIEKHLWKFFRLRPANFPTIRISQFAGLIYKSNKLLSQIIDDPTFEHIYNLFDIEAADYWKNHYTFGKPSVESVKHLGKSAIENIIINTITPFLFTYGRERANEILCDKALLLLEKVSAERNTIINQWQALKMPVNNAANTQSLIHLYNEYCRPKKCLSCNIGIKLLRT